MNVNERKYGFRLLEIHEVKDINAKLYHYVHEKSGGNVYHLENDDNNCCFAIGFRTLPENSTGVCHIIEHSLLCGSEKYPLKEPFVNLLKTSLATFLNAFTSSDWTMYPFASQTPKDFDNILSIYLDAVFRPLSVIDHKAFLQEGWHLELNNKDDLPQYKGIVYNEMKGAMSSVDHQLDQATYEAMYPNTIYSFNSGGDPDVIPELSYEDYKKFYYKHYTPQNAMTYFYGDLDIELKLKFLDEEYFSKYQKVQEEIKIPLQEPIVDLSYEKDYQIGQDEDIKDNTYMSLCYGLGEYDNYEELMAMQILNNALLSKNDSPIKKILLDAKLGQNVESYIDDGNIMASLHINLQKTNKDKKLLFKQTFENAISDIVKNGIDKSLLLATINFFEFKDKELDMGRTPKGLIFAMSMMGSFNYYGNILSHLEFSKHYDKYRREIDNRYFEKLLEKYILKSNHNVEVVLNPSNTLGKEKEDKMNLLMKNIKDKMSEKEIDDLIKLNQELTLYQNHIDTKEELNTLPKLELKDIPPTINFLDSKQITLKKMKGFTHTLNTNNIAYTRLYFSLNVLTEEELPYVYLLTHLYLNVPTKKYSSLELTNLVKTYLGDLSFKTLILNKNRKDCKLYLCVSSSALLANVNYLPTLINEVILKSKFTNSEVKQVLTQLTTSLKRGIINDGMKIAMDMARSHYSLDAYYSLYMGGPKLLDFLNNMLNNYNYKEICEKLKFIANKIYSYDNVEVSVSGDKETLKYLKTAMKKIKLYDNNSEENLNVKLPKPSKEGLVIPSGVSYNALCNNLEDFGEKFSAKFIVLSQIVNYDYLWTEVRVKGGAYGCGLSIDRSDNVCFGSYRDPNVKITYDVFKNLSKYLKTFNPTKDEFRNYIIGALGGFDMPMSTPSFIDSGDNYYLLGKTKKEKIELKKSVIKTKLNDIKSLDSLFENMLKDSSEYTIGNETKIKEYPFDNIKNL